MSLTAKMERKSDDEFAMRVQGIEEDDPVFKAKREEENKRRQDAIEFKRKEEEEAFQRRMQRI